MNLVPGKINVAHIISALGRGGMEYAVARLVLEQKRLGCRVQVICIRDFGPTLEILQSGGVPVHLSYFRSRLHPGSLARLRRLLLKLEVNVVQTHNYRPNVSGTVAARLARVPAVISSLRTVNRWDTLRQFWMDRLLCLFRDAIVCVSGEVRDRYIEKIKWRPQKCRVIHNGVDPEILKPMEPARELFDKYKLDPDSFYVISIARLVKIKDHKTLIRGFRKVAEREKRAMLLILGDGPMRGELEGLTREMGLEDRVRFMGHQDNISQWLSISDVSVLSTHIEGFSSTILESMAAGIPVIATAVGGNLEAVQDGVTGYLTPHEDGGAITDRLLELMSDPSLRQRMGQKARELVRDRFSIESTARETIALYQSILEKKG